MPWSPSPAYARYVLFLLFVVYVFNFIDRQILAILLEAIKHDLGASDTQMGFLSGFAFAFFYTCAGIPIARWADRGSRRTIIALGLAMWSAMTAASGFARSFAQLALARVGVGVGEAAGNPPAHSLLSDYFPPHRRATALGIYATGIYVGSMIALLGGGYILKYFDWRTAFFLVGLPGIPLALLVRLTVREPPRTGPAHGRGDGLAAVLRHVMARRSFVWIALAASCQALPGYSTLAWGPAFLGRVHHLSAVEIGTSMGLIVGFGGSAGAYLGGRLTDRLGRHDQRWYVLLSALVCLGAIPFAAGFLLADRTGLALASFVPACALSNMYVGPMLSMTQGLVPPHMRATASAILLFILNLIGLGAGPLVVGALSDALTPRLGAEGLRYALLVVVLMGVPAAAAFAMASRSLREDLRAGAG
jgi:MFS family permease